MIPKIIHYCWLSEEKYPNLTQQCINSWKQLLPNYEFILWDQNRFDIKASIWVKEAVENKKYAFAADYIRLYALYHFGGIYLDCDVEVVKDFDELLKLPYFVCKENSKHEIEAAVMGAEKGCKWIGKCLSFYENKHFTVNNQSFSMDVLPKVMANILTPYYQFKDVTSIHEFKNNIRNHTICRFPVDYFSPKSYVTKKIKITKNTRTIHHFAGTWQPWWKKVLLRIWLPLSIKHPAITNKIKTIFKKC